MVRARLGSFDLARLKCGVWDWGDRFTQPKHHLEEVAEHYAALADAPPHITAGLRVRLGIQDSAE